MNNIAAIYSTRLNVKKLNKNGNKKVNSISYSIRNTANIKKLKLIWMFNSDIDLNPHS